MVILLTIVHVIVCLFLIIVVLLQSGKAADLAGAFGGMGSQTAFGPRGAATILSKATTVAAGLFMVTSLSLSIFATRGAGGSSGSVLEQVKTPPPVQTKGGTSVDLSKQPSVTIFPEGTDPKQGVTMPLDVPPPPGQGQTKQGQQSAPPPAPAKK
jgi:preprotein translocase subunit SecG